MLRYILLIIICNFIIESKVLPNKNQEISKCLSNANIAFNNENYNQCILNLYGAIHFYKRNNDNLNVSKCWFEVAVLHFFNYDLDYASACLELSCDYANKEDAKDYKNIFQLILNWTNNNFEESIEKFHEYKAIDFHLTHLSSIINLMNLNAIERGKSTLDKPSSLLKWIKTCQQEKDTNWFGYPLTMHYIEKFYRNRRQSQLALVYNINAIHHFEDLHIFEKSWIQLYSDLFNNLFRLNRFSEIEFNFSHFINIYKKSPDYLQNEIDYENTKTSYLDQNNNYQAELDDYLKIYIKSARNQPMKISTIKNIIETNFYLQHYLDIIKWFNLIPINDRSAMDYCYVSIAYNQEYDNVTSRRMAQLCEQKIKLTDYNYISCLTKLIEIYRKLNDIQNKNRLLHLGLDYCKKKLQKNLITSLNYQGFFFWYANDFESSLKIYNKLISLLTNTSESKDLYELPDISRSLNDNLLKEFINNKAESFYQLSKVAKSRKDAIRYLKLSIAHFELSIQVSERLRVSLSFEDQKLTGSDLQKRYYPNIIKTCLEVFKYTHDSLFLEKAFNYVEKSKAALLLSYLQSDALQHTLMIPENLIQLEKHLQTEYTINLQRINQIIAKNQTDSKALNILSQKQIDIKFSQDSLMNVFKTKYTTYYNTFTTNHVVTTKDIQSKISPNEAIIEYSLTYDFMAIFLITKSSYKFYTDTVGNSFFQDIALFQKRSSTFNYADIHDTAIQSYNDLSYRLYKHLIEPVQQDIDQKKLVIIPDDVLNQIPFEALITNKYPGKGITYKDLHYLMKDHVISYNYSGTLYAMNNIKEIIHHTKILAMSPSYISESTLSNGNRLSEIKGALNEIKLIKTSYPYANIIGHRATVSKFMEFAPNYDILHLAMHGMINNEDPMFSQLIFTKENNDKGNDNLKAYEMYNMHLKARLVILSACNTGSGKLHTGEGIISLARGFFSAGAKSVIMTLWSVADKSSSQLINNFYHNLSEKKSTAESLRNAKIEYLKTSDKIKGHPYFWSGYIVAGNTNLIFEPNHSINWIWIIVTASGVILLTITVRIFFIQMIFQRKHKFTSTIGNILFK